MLQHMKYACDQRSMEESVLFLNKGRHPGFSVIDFQTTSCHCDVMGCCVFANYGTAHNKQSFGILCEVSCHVTTNPPWKKSPGFYCLLMAILHTNIKDKSESLAVWGRQHWEQAQVIWFYQCCKSWDRKYTLAQCHGDIMHLKHMQASVVQPGAFAVLFNAILYHDWR